MTTALDSKCPSCGSALKWNPELQAWKCESCDSKFTLEELQDKQNKAALKDNNKEEEVVDSTTVTDNIKTELKKIKEGEMDEYICPDCGASILTTPETIATKCPYCNNINIMKQKLNGGVYPTKIIPFKKVRQDAEEGFRNISKGKLFAPANFHKDSKITDVSGVYVPFWLYDITADGEVTFRCTDTRVWMVGDYQHTETKVYRTTMAGNIDFDKLPVDGSSHFDDGLMDSLEPFDYKDLVDYNHAYLSGFLAEKYDVDNQESFKRAHKRVEASALANIQAKTPHGGKSLTKNALNYKVENCEFAMFPVWMVNIYYDGKYYTFSMNGETGKTVGNIPLSPLRIILFTLLFFAIVFIISFLIIYFIGGMVA